jgi:transcriptional regulator with XRE-family HTH domain
MNNGAVWIQKARRLKELRGKTSLNQIEVQTGIARRLLKAYEDGEKIPKDENLRKISHYHQIPFSDLKSLQLEDLYPEGSENREIVVGWVQQILSKKK